MPVSFIIVYWHYPLKPRNFFGPMGCRVPSLAPAVEPGHDGHRHRAHWHTHVHLYILTPDTSEGPNVTAQKRTGSPSSTGPGVANNTKEFPHFPERPRKC